MTPKKFLLAIAVSLSIFVLYFGFGTEPDIEIVNVFGFKWGGNISDYIELKLLSGAAWFGYFLYPNDDGKDD